MSLPVKLKAKQPFSGSLKAKFKKILKHSDQNSHPSRSSANALSDASTPSTPRAVLQALPETSFRKSRRPLLSELLFSSDERPADACSSKVEQPASPPSLPPLVFDASSSNTSLNASSTACSAPIDERSPSPIQSPLKHHNHSHKVPGPGLTSPKTPRLRPRPRSPPPESPWSPNSTLVAFEGPYRSPQREGKPLQPTQAGSRRNSPRVSELVANYEALAIVLQAQDPVGPSCNSPSPSRRRPRRHGPDFDCDHLEQIRSLEKRIEELEKESEEQVELITEMREENESFYMRLCEANRQNKKLKKRLRTIAQSALNINSDDESDYGHESASRLGQTQNSALAFGPNAAATPAPQSESECQSESTPSFRRSFFSQRSRSYRNSHNLHNIEALRSDMLSKPHGFYLDSDCDEYDWCEENGPTSTNNTTRSPGR